MRSALAFSPNASNWPTSGIIAFAKVKKIKDNSAEIERVSIENRRLKTELAEISEKMVSKTEFEKLAAEKKVLTAKLSGEGLRALAEKDGTIKAFAKRSEHGERQAACGSSAHHPARR